MKPQRVETKHIEYFSGVKYVLAEDAWFLTPFRGYAGGTSFVNIYPDGWMHIRAGWAWDGASGPTINTKSSMRGSLAHDGVALLMRQGVLPHDTTWEPNDCMLERICVEDKMWPWRARLWRKVLGLVKGSYGDPKNKRVSKVAP